MKQALILAAGKGTRMLPLTKDTPKPLLEVNGKPFLCYLLENLNKAGYDKVIVIVEYLKEQIIDYFKNHEFDFDLEFVSQGEPLGTGHAVLCAKNAINGEFAVINGDDLYSLNDLKSIPFGDNFNYIFGLNHHEPNRFGVLVCDGELLVDLEEKPEVPKSNLINIGLYKFTPEVFEILENVEKSERGEIELTSAVGILAKKGLVKFREAEYWQPFGKLDDIPIVKKFIGEHF